MINLYEAIKESPAFSKMQVSELLFAEYTCMKEETRLGIWSDSNYFAFISSGKKLWKTIYNAYEVEKDDIIFIKKGANLVHQFFDDQFCAIFIFIPDEFIRNFLAKHSNLAVQTQNDLSGQDAILPVQRSELLESYHHSIRSYLAMTKKPPEQLLKLKFEELLLSLFSNKQHQDLTNYLVSLCQNQQYQMGRVMEENFAYNLKLENYAQLCHMSLSAFKKSFKELYNTTPAAWLKNRKLHLACQQISGTGLSVSQVSFDCGFEDTSHFIRVFKQKYQLTPLQYRHNCSKAVHHKILTAESIYSTA